MNKHHIIPRFDRLPVWPFPYKILLVVGAGFFFGFFDIITIAIGLPVIQKQFHISMSTASWAISSGLIGYIIGSFVDSRISDHMGRRLALYLSVGFYSVGSLLSATSTTIGWLIAWRVISGMGIGAEISEVTTYMSEMSPKKIRGRLSSIAIATGFLGFAVVPFIGLALVPNFSWGWRGLFVIGGLGGIVIMFMRRHIPSTVRWLILHRRFEEADRIVTQAEALVTKRIKKTLPPVPPMPAAEPTVSFHRGVSQIFQSPYLMRLVLFSMIWCFYYIGNYAWLSLNVELFVDYGYNLKNSIGFVAINSIGFIAGSVLAIGLSDRFERKYTVFWVALMWTCCLLIVGWLPKYWVIIVFGFLASTTIAILIPVLYTYTAENFPTRIRATSVALTDGFGHIGGAFCAQIVLGIYQIFHSTGYGYQASFTAMAVTGLVSAILILFGTKMTGRSLSNVSATQGQIEH